MAKRGDSRAADALLPGHWRDLREWSIEKRQSHRSWVLDVEAVLKSMERQLNSLLEKSPQSKCGNSPVGPPSPLSHSRSRSSQQADP